MTIAELTPDRLDSWATADLESARDELHTRCSRYGETLTDAEYAIYLRINDLLGKRAIAQAREEGRLWV